MPKNFELFVLITSLVLLIISGTILAIRLVWKIWTYDIAGGEEYRRLSSLAKKANNGDEKAQLQCEKESHINRRTQYEGDPNFTKYYMVPKFNGLKPFEFF